MKPWISPALSDRLIKNTLIIVLAALFPVLIQGKTLLDVQHTEVTDKDTSIYAYSFSMSQNGNRLIMNVDSDLHHGTLTIWFGGGGYQVIGNYTDDSTFTYDNVVFGPLNNTEPVQVKITATDARGDWRITFSEFSSTDSIIGLFIAGILILIISIGAIIWWKRRYHDSLKWIWIGGGVWAVGVILKFVFAILLNNPILMAINNVLNHTGYLVIGSLYIGSLTGIFEIGITLLLAILIKSTHRTPSRAIGIGIGAGCVEAILIGLSQFGNVIYVLSGAPGSGDVVGSLAQTMVINPVFFLLAPVERTLTILCHTSSRVLTFYAAARKKYLFFWAGFLLMTGLDAIAGYVHLAGLLNQITMWWIELALLPFAVISIPIIIWCLKHWPEIKNT